MLGTVVPTAARSHAVAKNPRLTSEYTKLPCDVLLERSPLPSMHVPPLPWAPPFIMASHQAHVGVTGSCMSRCPSRRWPRPPSPCPCPSGPGRSAWETQRPDWALPPSHDAPGPERPRQHLWLRASGAESRHEQSRPGAGPKVRLRDGVRGVAGSEGGTESEGAGPGVRGQGLV